jgi:hypothetical protein
MEGYDRNNKGGESQRTPKSRSKGFPHLDEILIGRIVDLDPLSLFPQVYARIMGGIERGQAFQGQQWRERERGGNELKRVRGCWGKNPP